MLDRRQHKLRRAMASGVVLAGLGMLPLCVIELVYVLAVRRPAFEGTGQLLLFVAGVLLVPTAAAAVVGLLEGLVALIVGAATQRLAGRRVAEPLWMALLYSALLLPAIALVAAKMFEGRRAQQIPGKHWIAIGVGLVGLIAAFGALRLVIGVRDRFRIRRWGPPQAVLVASALLILASLLYVVDQRVLARLYFFFHVGLTLGAVACCQGALAVLHAAWRPKKRWLGKLVDPGLVLMSSLALVAAGAWALRRIEREDALRYLAHEHTALQSKVLMLAGGLGAIDTRGASFGEVAAAEPPADEAALRAGPRRPEADLLLVSIDALRSDHIGIYGYPRPTTPNIDRWAKEATVFLRGYCPIPHTSFSLTSLMTGTHMHSAPGGEYPTLPAVLRRYGYKTGGFFPPAVFYIDSDRFSSFSASMFNFEYVKYEFIDAGRRVDQVIRFLRDEKGGRVFVWVHFFEPHHPYKYRAKFDFGQRDVDRYDGEIAYVDHQLGRLLRYVKKARPNMVVALTGDHGEAFGEHGDHYHGSSLYDEQTRVPVIISVPDVAGRVVEGWAQSIDLPVTMLSLVDIPVPATMRGNDLGPWIVGENPEQLPPALAEIGHKKMVVHEHHKLIYDTVWDFNELYDLQSDPQERKNIAGRARQTVARLRGKLTRWSSARRRRDDRTETAELLSRGRKRDLGAVPGLIRLAKHGSVEVQREALKLLTALRARAARGVLIEATRALDPGVRIQAIIGAALLGHRPSLEQLRGLLGRPDLPPAMRRDALLALAGSGDRRTTRPLCRILAASDDVYERVELIDALGRLGDPAAIPTVRGQLTTLRTRRAAIDALGLLKARSQVPALVKSLREDKFTSWRADAARALGNIGDKRAIVPLQEAAARELEHDVVAWSLRALWQIGRQQALSTERLRPLPIPAADCDAAGCRLSLERRCGTAEELLVVVEDKRQQLTVHCGEKQVGELDLSKDLRGARRVERPVPAAVVPLVGQRGTLQVRGKGPLGLRYLGLRAIPQSRAELAGEGRATPQ